VKEVASRPIRGMLAAARKLGLDVPALLAGLPFDEATIERNARVDWDAFVDFVDRVQAAVGGLAGLHKVGDLLHEAFPEVNTLLGHVISPLRFFRFFWGPITRSAFPHVVVDYREHPPDRVTIAIALPEKYRDSPGFFVLTEAATRHGTRYIGLPPAQVQMELRPRSATYHVVLPPPRRFAATIDDVAEAAIAAVETVHSRFIQLFKLSEARAAAEDDERRRRAAAAWKLTPREAEVFELLLRGKSNKEIAATLRCAEATVELHVTRLLRKSGASSRMALATQFLSRA
jgi:DNA-binding CsgD family transcriptional regulator